MTRMTKLLFLPGIWLLLLLAGTESAPKTTTTATEEPPEKHPKALVRDEATLPPKTTTKWHEKPLVRNEPTLPPKTTTKWHEKPHEKLQQRQITNCSVSTGRIVASSGAVGIGSIGGNYNDNEYCVWEIEVPEGLIIRFTWEYFELEGPESWCPYDYVDISDYATGDSLTGRVCGSSIPRSVRSRSNTVRVTFSSDISVTFQGFGLRFEASSDVYETTETTTTTWPPQTSCSVDTGNCCLTSRGISTDFFTCIVNCYTSIFRYYLSCKITYNSKFRL
ncbi:exoskeleton protein RP43-like isoform X2 [Macrobrachium nipponense]|uniref:exoskeleton protein RP43-like isoform X2 n=1 Tax=Macrobrachium nipponense TaxID=159736 RepID=UPI0030C84BD4